MQKESFRAEITIRNKKKKRKKDTPPSRRWWQMETKEDELGQGGPASCVALISWVQGDDWSLVCLKGKQAEGRRARQEVGKGNLNCSAHTKEEAGLLQGSDLGGVVFKGKFIPHPFPQHSSEGHRGQLLLQEVRERPAKVGGRSLTLEG